MPEQEQKQEQHEPGEHEPPPQPDAGQKPGEQPSGPGKIVEPEEKKD